MAVDNKKFFKFSHIILAFLVGSFIFSLIFVFAYSVSYFAYQQTSGYSKTINSSIAELNSILTRGECDYSSFVQASELLDVSGSRIAIIEERMGAFDARVLNLKARYTELELAHLNLTDSYNLRCGTNFTTILFFYSNKQKYQYENEKEAFILGTFKELYPKNVMIYSVDVDLNSSLVDALEKKYVRDKLPVLMIDKRKRVYLTDLDELRTHIFQSNK